MPNFHDYRSKPDRYTPWLRLWHWHDDHPLPPRLNKAARSVLFHARRMRQRWSTPDPVDGKDEHGEPVVSSYGYPEPVRPFRQVSLADVERRFRQIHAANETLYNGDGSWDPHPFMPLSGSGIPLEEVADRVVGYLGAFEAFGDPVYLERAEAGGHYLVEQRLMANGHIRLQGHHVVELEYGYAGCALLELWARDRSQTHWFDAARRIGDRLLEEHIGGAIDHALKAVQVLAPLYVWTGDERYLRAAIKRAFRAVHLQLPYGGWPGCDSRIWYHCIIARGLVEAYVATPNTLAYYAKKDRLARAITAATNRFALAQEPEGHVRVGRGPDDPVCTTVAGALAEEVAGFDPDTGAFYKSQMAPEAFVPRDTMDFLTTLYEELGVRPAAVMAHGLAAVAVRPSPHLRLEFETFVVGRYAQFAHRLRSRNRTIWSEIGLLPSEVSGDGAIVPADVAT